MFVTICPNGSVEFVTLLFTITVGLNVLFIEPITIGNDKDTNLLIYVFQNEDVSFAFKVALILGLVIIVFATIYAIIRSLAKEKPEGTPSQICMKAAKTLLLFLFIPAGMFSSGVSVTPKQTLKLEVSSNFST